MKIIGLFMASIFLSVGVFQLPHNTDKVVRSINPNDLTGLINDYIDENGCYTKKTTLYLTEEARQETQYFHGAANALQRATYYNDTLGALLMGDYDGTFTHINSGYRNLQEGGVQHFYYAGYETPSETDLFDNVVDDWSNQYQSVGEYYPNLTYLKTIIDGNAWNYDNNFQSFVYTPTITMTDGKYDDDVLRAFQYFIAPMMLQGNYFSWSSIRITKATTFLSMRLLASATDEGKSTVKGVSEVLVAEARVFRGLHLDAALTPATLKGSFNSWGDGLVMEECVDIYLPEQYKYVLEATSGTEIKVLHTYNGADHWYGTNILENGSDSWLGGSDNIVLNNDGAYTIYYKIYGNNGASIYIGFTPSN